MRKSQIMRTAGVITFAFAVIGLGGCNSGGTSSDPSKAGLSVASAPEEASVTTDWIPSLADLRGHVEMTDVQATTVDAALTVWRTAVANRSEKMRAGAMHADGKKGMMFPPVAQFLSECGKTLQTDQFVALANYLHQVQSAHKSQMPQIRKQFGDALSDRMIRRLVDQLALRPDQETQVRQIFQEFRDARKQAFANGTGSAPDTAGFRRMHEELLSRMGSVLTSDQMTQFKGLQQMRRQRQDTRKGEWKDARVANAVERLQGVLQLSDDQATQIKKILADLPAPPKPDGNAGHPGRGFGGPMMGQGGPLLLAESQIRTVLSPDQVRRFDAVLQLLPGRQDRP